MTRRPLCSLVLGIAFVLQAAPAAAQATTPAALAGKHELGRRIESALDGFYKPDEPGATVIVVKDGQTLLRKAFGMGSVAQQLALRPDMVMRLGSITKQFTAVGILLLADEGKLALTDPITRFIADYPVADQKVTIEHLLTHTSGIKSYTAKPGFMQTLAKDVTVQQMVDSIKPDPLEFEPGTRWRYSNSGYFLLGAIIEKASSMAYADFMAQRIFEPLGMVHTAYEGHERQSAPRAAGHRRGKEGFEPATVISMTQPYAAGALASTVDDLARWDAAITAGKLLRPATWANALTRYRLVSGELTSYGHGWDISQLQGSRVIAHGGGIDGFATYALRLPQEKVFVAVLSNADGGLLRPEVVANRVAALAIGKPFPDFKPVVLDAKALDALTGVYRMNAKESRTVERAGNNLVLARKGGPRAVLTPYGEKRFFREGSLLHAEFESDAKGVITGLTVHQSSGPQTFARTAEPLPAAPKEIKLDANQLDAWVGHYQIATDFIVNIRREGERLIAQATGQGPFELFASADNTFFARVAEIGIRFEQSADGAVSQLVLTQGGRDTVAKRLP